MAKRDAMAKRYRWELGTQLANEVQARDVVAAERSILALLDVILEGSGSHGFDEVKLRMVQVLSIANRAAYDADEPFIVIRLDKPGRVHAVRIVNRKHSLHERAEGLTLWVSDDETDWKRVWQAEDAAAEWLVDAGGVTCRYIKIGLPGRGILHLNQVTVFGN